MKRLWLTGGILLVLFALTVWLGQAPDTRIPAWLIETPPWVFLALAVSVILFGVAFQQSGPAFLALFFAVSYWAADVGDAAATTSTLRMVSVLMPLNFFVFFLLPERGCLSVYGAGRLTWILVQGGILRLLPRWTGWMADPVEWAPEWTPALLAAIHPAGWILAALVFAYLTAPLSVARMQRGWWFAGALALGGLGVWQADAGAVLPLALPGWMAALLAFMAALLWAVWDSAFLDENTRLPGRRALKLYLAQVYGEYAVLMVDIDHFKKINDRHGHDVGDQVLRFLAIRLKRFRTGRAYRFGGEEFTLVCTGRHAATAAEAAEELRKIIAASVFALRAPDRPSQRPRRSATRRPPANTLRVTVSIGVALRQHPRDNPWDVVRAADQALYRAKRAGRNRVMVAGGSRG